MTFIRKLEKEAKKAGFEDIQEMVCQLLVNERMTFTDLTQYIQEKFGIDRTYSAIYAALRKYAPEDFNLNTRFFQAREDLAKEKGYANFKEMLLDFNKRKLNYREVAEELGQKSPINVKRFERLYNIKLAADKETKRAGFVNQARYRYWLERAKKLGYNSVEAVFTDLKKGKKSVREVAEAFEVSPQSLWRRIKRLGS